MLIRSDINTILANSKLHRSLNCYRFFSYSNTQLDLINVYKNIFIVSSHYSCMLNNPRFVTNNNNFLRYVYLNFNTCEINLSYQLHNSKFMPKKYDICLKNVTCNSTLLEKKTKNVWKKHSSIIDIGEASIVPDEFSNQDISSGFWWKQLAAGGIAGVFSRTCTAPLDRLKVLIQTQSLKRSKFRFYSGFNFMLKEGGMLSFWRGNGVNILKIAPESSLKFYAYENFKIYFSEDRDGLFIGLRFISASFAGTFAQSIIYPLEVIKTRLTIAATNQYSGVWNCAQIIFMNEGVRGFYKGWVPNMIGILPYAGIDLTLYETIKNYYMHRYYDQFSNNPGVLLPFLCGIISSTCGQLCCYPLTLIRTRFQAESMKKCSMYSMLKEIIKLNGFPGLYRGIMPNCLKVIPSVSISYVMYERMRTMFGIYRE